MSSSQEATTFLTLVADPRDEVCNFKSGKGYRDDSGRPVRSVEVVLFPVFNPQVIFGLIEMNPIAQRNGVLF